MTNEQIDALTPAELRVAVAEALGWTHGDFLPWNKQMGRWIGRDPVGSIELVPNWSNDIAAAWGLVENSSPEWKWEITVYGKQAGVRLYAGARVCLGMGMIAEAICRAWLKARATK